MAITVEQKYGSIRYTANERLEIGYVVQGTDDYDSALAAVESETQETIGDLERQPVDLDEEHGDTDNSEGIWTATVEWVNPTYTPYTPPETGDSNYSFDTSGGTQHITQALSVEATCGDAGDFDGAIGVSGDGENLTVEGCDITVPVYSFGETHYIPAATVDAAYKNTLFNLTGKVNNGSFRGLDAGECLFLGARGQQRASGEDWEIQFCFAASPNQTEIAIGSVGTLNKKGWEYLWVRYGLDVDATYKRPIKKPIGAQAVKVYNYGDFSGLGIGTGA